ncbi:GNAT family N-acetyltransferase [Shouchella hunanensis]|uniref:GNAT family N-acetyltransferase n=1 Tax=Shouchella hunanensis TaxID=766894 RepID=A0ABY7W444_9BACI|nr:GNAT family N-acetyltransferase [Shouchella hunanensis]WDF02246.1 GNAT family N-acetyltransferase [Shouchella hunanensis]
MRIREIKEDNRTDVEAFFSQQWGSPLMVVASGVYDCSELDGYVALNEAGDIIGLLTFAYRNGQMEVMSLDSVKEGVGVGTALLETVENGAREKGKKAIHLVTTNDNVHALAFYQRRGYVLHKLYKEAVKKARLLKPEIPHVAENGIPIRDEIELIKSLV